MAKRLVLELPFFELSTASGLTVVTSLAFPEVVGLADSPKRMAQRLTDALQKQLIDQGEALEALQWVDSPVLHPTEVVVEVPQGKNPLLQPAWRCRHVVFMSAPDAAQGLALVPALGVIAMAPPERLLEAVTQAVRLEMRRAGRRAEPRLQVSAQWFEQVSCQPQSLNLVFHSAEELRKLQMQQELPLLRSVASEMVGQRRAVGLEASLEAFQRATDGRLGASVLVLGAQGSGKTALVQHQVSLSTQRCWATSAGRLIQALTADGSWQAAWSRLCKELAEQHVVLYVGHLIELFEVGQYEGNAVSLGDALREPVARGRIQVWAEATEAELALLELRSPGLAALFQQVRLPEQDPAAQAQVVVRAVAALADAHRVTVAPEVVTEMLALQRRFSPYSGFPGKAIRFFETLILQLRAQGTDTLTREQAWIAFGAETGLPRALLDPALPLDLAEVKAFFERRLFGQAAAIEVVLGVLATTKAGLARTGKPIASLLLIGPTGVGKTETAKALAEFMFGDARRMIRLDMSEYADPGSVLRLLGDSGTEGSLLGAVRRQPFSVVLLDELEKADASFFDLLLQVLGEGRLTGADGQTVNFCGTLVLMTSNLGAQALQRSPMAMVASTDDPRRHFEQAVQAALRPELFNRIDHVVPYAVLSGAQRVPIFEREIALMRQREGLRERQITLSLDVGTAAHLATLPGDARYGARDVQRVLRQQVLLPLAHAVAPHAAVQAISVQISPQDGVLKVRTDVLQQPLDSAPLRVAQAAAQARRRWQQAADGPLVVYLANQAFSLEREHQRHNKKRHKLPTLPHWDETAQAHRQRTLKGVRTRFDALQHDILLLEDEALQALMGERSEPPSLVPWEARFAALKQEVFSASRPGSNLCTLGLYGPRPLLDTLLITWTELFHLAGFKARVQVVCLRDPKAKMGLAPPTPPARPESVDEDEVAAPPEPPPVYVREDWPLPPGKSLPTQSVIAGFEIEVKGAAVFDYLSGEAGMWRVFEGQHKSDLWVAVRNQALDDFETPWGVHRRLFFSDKTVHRQIKEACLSDAAGQWRVDWPQVQLWKALLDRHMGHTIDRLLLGQTEESNA